MSDVHVHTRLTRQSSQAFFSVSPPRPVDKSVPRAQFSKDSAALLRLNWYGAIQYAFQRAGSALTFPAAAPPLNFHSYELHSLRSCLDR